MKKSASIVSVGSWNPRIFTPSWVSANVFAMPEGESMNISLNEKQMNLAYTWKDILLLIVDRGIEMKSDKVSMETLQSMEEIYNRLSQTLPYTPLTAVGFNLNLILTKDEYEKTTMAGLITQQTVDIYKSQSQSFVAEKDGAIRSFDIRKQNDSVEIRCNFHYNMPQELPTCGSVFPIIISEQKHFLGYELSI